MNWLIAYIVVTYVVMWLSVRAKHKSPDDASDALVSAMIVVLSPITCVIMVIGLTLWMIAASLGYRIPLSSNTELPCPHGANGRATTAAARRTTPTE